MTRLSERRRRPRPALLPVLSAAALATAIFGGILPGLSGPAAAQTKAQAPTKAQVIEDLVYANRILAAKGVLDGFGHISARSPDDPTHFLISRSLAPALVTAKDIVELDQNGEPVTPTKVALYSERFIHAGAYRARPEVNAVLHSHSPEVLPFTLVGRPLRAVLHDAAFLGQGVPVFEGDPDGRNATLLIRDMPTANALAAKLGRAAVVLIRGHGDMVVGSGVADVVTRAIYTDKNAKVLKEALMLGGPIAYIKPEETAERGRLMAGYKEGRDWNLMKAEIGDVGR